MATRRLEVVIVGDTKQLERAFGRAGSASQSFGKRASSSLAVLGKGALIGAAVTGVALVTKSLFDSVGAAREAEQAQTRLRSAVKAAGVSFDVHGKAIDRAIQKTSKLAAIDDEELSDSFSRLVRTTGSVSKAMEGMNLAADIARARGIDLAQATNIVEKAHVGQLRGLKTVGIELEKGTTATEALERAQKKFAGSAAAYGKSAAAAQDNLKVAFENLQESVGQKLLPVLAKLAIKLTELINWSEQNWPKFKEAAEPVFKVVMLIVDNLIDRIQAIAKVIEGVVTIIRGIRDGSWSQVWAGIKQVAVGQFDLIVASVIALPAKILGALGKAAFAGMSRIGEWMKDAILGGFSGIVSAVVGVVRSAIDSVMGFVNSAIDAYNKIPLLPNVGRVSTPKPPGGSGGPPAGYQRAAGGPVRGRNAYMVGERGPEMFVPSDSGSIIPNGGGGWGATVNITVNGWVGNDQDLARRLRDELVRDGRRNTSIFSAPGVTV